MFFEKVVEEEEHEGCDGGKSKSTDGEDGEGGVGFFPEVCFGDGLGIGIHDARNEGDDLENHDEGSAEEAKKRNAVDLTDGEVEEGQGPGEEGENFA